MLDENEGGKYRASELAVNAFLTTINKMAGDDDENDIRCNVTKRGEETVIRVRNVIDDTAEHSGVGFSCVVEVTDTDLMFLPKRLVPMLARGVVASIAMVVKNAELSFPDVALD